MTFSATDAALEGFKITRARPAAIAAWAGILLASHLASQALAIGALGSRLETFSHMTPFSPMPQDEAMRAMPAMVSLLIILAAVSLPVMAVLCASVNRAVLRPNEGGFAWLAVGADELRQALVLLSYWLALSLAMIGGIVASAVLFSPLSAFGGAGQFAAAALTIYVAVRLSFAIPATFDRRKFVFLESWGMTGPKQWPLLGSYVVAWLFSLFVSFIVALFGTLIAMEFKGPESGIAADFASLFGLRLLIAIAFGAVAEALALPLRVAPLAYAYRALAGGGDVARIFV